MSFIEKLMEKDNKEFAKDIIIQYMKKKKIDTFEELIKDNPDLASFEQNTKFENYTNIIRNHGFNLTQDTYEELLDMIKQELDDKKKLDTNIEKYNVGDKEFAAVTDNKTGEKVVFDNSVSNRNIEAQMETVQDEHKQFQSTKNNANNTTGVMNYMKENIKITADTVSSNELEQKNNFNEDEMQIMKAVKLLEIDVGHPVNVDLNSKMVYDNDIVYIIEKRDGVYQIIPVNEEKSNEKAPQRVLTSHNNNNTNVA